MVKISFVCSLQNFPKVFTSETFHSGQNVSVRPNFGCKVSYLRVMWGECDLLIVCLVGGYQDLFTC